MKKYNKKYNYYKAFKDINEIIEKRFNLLISLIVFSLIILISTLFYIQVIKKDYYASKVEKFNQNIVYGSTAPRGRMYDRNGNIIVDNVAIKVIYYKKPKNVTTKEEINIANILSNKIEIDYSNVTSDQIKTFWIISNPDLANGKITLEERQLLKERKITNDDIWQYKIDRVTEEETNSINKKTAYIYHLMNKGYSYEEKTIKKNATDLEYAYVGENISNLNGVNTRLDWERIYPYGDAFRSILGNISSSNVGIPYEYKEYYLNKGYSLNDQVGISYLEYQYDEYLKGTKNVYEITKDGSYKLISEGKRGNDLVLTIDINLQKEVEKILEEELVLARNEPNTEYFNKAFAIITNPNTGEVLAMAGKQISENGMEYKIYDYTSGIVTTPVVAGSSVKGASQIVGYNTSSLQIGEVRDDTCIKIAATKEKCSIYYMGKLDDIGALARSSNTYQFNTAINVAKAIYRYNEPLVIDTNAFSIYRNTFAEFGLGVKTGIDLPVESLGYKGTSTMPGHLLDFAIGQYDTYTPIQLSQYISTIASGGDRIAPTLLKGVYDSTYDSLTNLIYEKKPIKLNVVNTDSIYLDRVKLGLKAVIEYGTGYGYIDLNYKPAGKTGTSQSFIDTNQDGIVDKETVTNTFVAYAPYDNPMVTFTIVSPDVSHDGATSYRSNVNKRIAQQVIKKYFQFYQ